MRTAFVLIGVPDPGIASDTLVTCTDTTRLDPRSFDRYCLVRVFNPCVTGTPVKRYVVGRDLTMDMSADTPLPMALDIINSVLTASDREQRARGPIPDKAVRFTSQDSVEVVNTRSMHLRVVGGATP